VDSKPEELDNLNRQIMQLQIEREAIKKEKDKAKLSAIEEQLSQLQAEAKEMNTRWEREKGYVATIQNEKAHIEQMKREAEIAEREGNYGKVAEIRYGRLQQAEANIRAAQEALHAMQGESLIKEEVDEDDIAEVVARWTGIPVNKMMQSEREKLLHLEEELHRRVVGQDEAIQAVSDAIRRSRAGLQDPKRPIGSFIFLGTTGVGKTELAKALADYLFDNENMMTRIDMSEYQEKFAATRLIGAPPGYVGYDEGGQLTEAIRRKPYSVVLFDEIEKAHPDVFNVLLQVLDDGRLTDNKGRTVNFKNTLIIFTSNLGSQLIRENEEKGIDHETTSQQVLDMLRQTVRPEFLNRIDETIMFTPLNESQIRDIVGLQIESVHKMLMQSGIDLRITDDAIDYIAHEGYDPQFGARPVKRALQRLVLNELSKAIIAGKVDHQKPVIVELRDGALQFKN
jgi:ATP-dependent Clp protease ATP-binding subunit ClpB